MSSGENEEKNPEMADSADRSRQWSLWVSREWRLIMFVSVSGRNATILWGDCRACE